MEEIDVDTQNGNDKNQFVEIGTGRTAAVDLSGYAVVLIDGGCQVDGYWSDITRTRFFGGGPPAEFTRVHRIVRDAQTAAIERVRPGVAAEEIDRAAREVIERAGFGARNCTTLPAWWLAEQKKAADERR